MSEITPLQRSMEEALVENPEELATHSAYADYLMDQGNPRGEFIQVQLSLENANVASDERARLRFREAELLSQHASEWLGDLGPCLVGDWSGPDKPYHYQFARGWLDTLRFLPAPEGMFPVLAQAPEIRLLRRLEILYDMRYHPYEFAPFYDGPCEAFDVDGDNELYNPADILPALVHSHYLGNLRAFTLGFSNKEEEPQYSTMISVFRNCTTDQMIQLLQRCPRMEELSLNTHLAGIDKLFSLPVLNNLQVLQYYYGANRWRADAGNNYPLSALANNTSLRRLTTLRCHPGRDARIEIDQLDALVRSPNLPALVNLQVRMVTPTDEAVRRIVASGILTRLTSLDLAYGDMTDEGARLLAESDGIGNLKSLNVLRNHLTDDGIARLRATGVDVHADRQGPFAGDDYDNRYYVDVE